MEARAARKLALELMREHNVTCEFRWSQAWHSLGVTRMNQFGPICIMLSRKHVESLSEPEVRWVVLHEIAHAQGHWLDNHGEVWRKRCEQLGIVPSVLIPTEYGADASLFKEA